MFGEVVLEGSLVRLRPPQIEDVPLFHAWMQDEELRRMISRHDIPPPTLEEEYEWFVQARSDDNSLRWSIEGKDGTLLGNLRLGVENPRVWDSGVMIGDPRQRNRGYGTDATKTALRYTFLDRGCPPGVAEVPVRQPQRPAVLREVWLPDRGSAAGGLCPQGRRRRHGGDGRSAA